MGNFENGTGVEIRRIWFHCSVKADTSDDHKYLSCDIISEGHILSAIFASSHGIVSQLSLNINVVFESNVNTSYKTINYPYKVKDIYSSGAMSSIYRPSSINVVKIFQSDCNNGYRFAAFGNNFGVLGLIEVNLNLNDKSEGRMDNRSLFLDLSKQLGRITC